MPARARALLLANGSHAAREDTRDILVALFTEEAGLDVDLSADLADLNVERIRSADLFVDYSGTARNTGTGRLELDDAQLREILTRIERGTPYIGMHAASVPFAGQIPMSHAGDRVYARNIPGWQPLWRQLPERDRPSPALATSPSVDAELTEAQRQYLAMIGSAFISHLPLADCPIRILDHEHPITRGIDDFDIEDEHYELAGDLSAVRVLAESRGCPIMYTKRWGNGPVHYTALGHDHRALRSPSQRQLLIQAVRWALAGG
jgi:type 1 glutamine amidotransferase